MNLTRIHQIEVTNRCNLACKYCPHPKLKRTKEDMLLSDFERAMEWVNYFDEIGTQPELALTGMGEALLHPDIDYIIDYVRKSYHKFVHLSTNGILFDENVAALCKDYSIGVFISEHRPELAGPAIQLANKYGILMGTNHSFVDSALDFAGSVEWFNSAPEQLCMYQKEAWGMVLSNGDINTCCWEPEGENVIGSIWDRIGSVEMKIMPKCADCSLIIQSPKEARA